MKKSTILIPVIAVLSVWLLIGLIFSPYIINDIACANYENKVNNIVSNEENVKLLEIVSGCGNSSGTGNHTDLYVAVLIETSLSKEKVKEAFNNVRGINLIKTYNEQTLAMSIINLQFSKTEFINDKNYYILEFVKKAPLSDFDLRGH